jgi:hypothetical protein
VDIDDHECGGWNGIAPTDFLRKRFAYVLSEIGKGPSMIFRSPRGIHVFWFLTENLPNKIIEECLNARFNSKFSVVEVLPTARHALAIPRPQEYLDLSLKPAVFPGYSRGVTYYDKVAVLGQDCLPESLKQKHKSRKTAGGEKRERRE